MTQEREAGDCWIGLSLANTSGLILAARVGKHTDALIEQLVSSTEGKTDCKQFNSDDWGGYERVLPPEVQHHIGKDKTQRLERTNGIIRQQTPALASTTQQVWQGVGTDESNDSISGELQQNGFGGTVASKPPRRGVQN